MSELNIKINDAFFITAVPNAFIDGYLNKLEPLCALIYIYLCRHSANPENCAAANVTKVFDITEKKCRAAFSSLKDAGLIDFGQTQAAEPAPAEPILTAPKSDTAAQTVFAQRDGGVFSASKMPVYPAQELEIYARSAIISDLFQSAEAAFGRLLDYSDHNCIYGIYDYLRLDVDVIKYLFECCASNMALENKSTVKPAYLKAVAVDWANERIKTAEEAEEYVLTFSKTYKTILKNLGLYRQNPAPAQKKLIDKWLNDYKMPLETILYGCDKTVLHADKPSFAYLDSIIEKWHENDVLTVDEAKNFGSDFYENLKQKNKRESKRSKFANFSAHDRDWAELARKEQELVRKIAEGE